MQNSKSFYKRIYVIFIALGAMGIVTYLIDQLLNTTDHIIVDIIVAQIIANTIAAHFLVKELKKQRSQQP